MEESSYVYILANRINTVLYIGATSDLAEIKNNKEGKGSDFTKKNQCSKVVYYETFSKIEEAIERESHIKNWKRKWKKELIENRNPRYRDLFDSLLKS